MRDYRDAKTMAHMLREMLAAKHYKITVSESLELIAKLFGLPDWNSLSAVIKHAPHDRNPAGERGKGGGAAFSETTEMALHSALAAAQERGQQQSTVEHLLLALTEDPDAITIMKVAAVDRATVREALKRSAELEGPAQAPDWVQPDPSPVFQRVVQRAILESQALEEWPLTGAGLLIALLAEEDTTAVRILRDQGLHRGRAMKIAGRGMG